MDFKCPKPMDAGSILSWSVWPLELHPHYIYGDKSRIVLIDKWDIPVNDRYHTGSWIDNKLGTFLCKIAVCPTFDGIIRELYTNEDKISGALFTNNRKLMVFPNGFKNAAEHVDDIITFLNNV